MLALSVALTLAAVNAGSSPAAQSLPEPVRKALFDEGQFAAPITLRVPCEDGAQSYDYYRKRLGPSGSTAHKSLGPIFTSQFTYMGKDELAFLQATGFVRVETLLYPKASPNRYDFIFYTGRPTPCPVTEQSGPAPPLYLMGQRVERGKCPFNLLIGKRKLAEITYVNQFKQTPLGGPEMDVVATTFTYALESQCPGMPPVQKTFEGKAQAVLDPRDGKWHLKSVSLPDQDLSEFMSVAKSIVPAHVAAARSVVSKAAAEPGARTTDSGLVYVELTAGTGEQPKATDTVKVHYRGTIADGTAFGSSYDSGQPATFPLDKSIKCWGEGLQLMRVGGKSKLVCPPEIAYGDRGSPPTVKPGDTVIFEVELLEIAR